MGAVRTGQCRTRCSNEDRRCSSEDRTEQGPEQPWQVTAAPCSSSPAQPSLASALGAFCTSLHGVCSEAGRGRVPRSAWSPAEQRCECQEQGQSVLGAACPSSLPRAEHTLLSAEPAAPSSASTKLRNAPWGQTAPSCSWTHRSVPVWCSELPVCPAAELAALHRAGLEIVQSSLLTGCHSVTRCAPH